MTPTAMASTTLALHPIVPLWLLTILLGIGVLLVGIAILQRARGWPLRALALVALGAALFDPRIVHQERHPRPDVALVVVDDSASQHIGSRMTTAEDAAHRVEAELGKLPGLDVRTLHAGSEDASETRLFDTIERAVLDGVVGRLAGIVIIGDGQVHDAPAAASTLPWLTAPLHLLLTGHPDEVDQRIVVEDAPAYGLVGENVNVAYRVERLEPAQPPDQSHQQEQASVHFRIDGVDAGSTSVPVGTTQVLPLPIRHPGPVVLEIEVDAAPGEVSALNNRTAVVVNGVRERLRVLLVSGKPHPGERSWRNLLKSDPSVDLVHFTILRPPEKDDATPLKELSLIVFPVQELFETKLNDFDLIILDRYIVRGILPKVYYTHIADYVRKGGALLVEVGPEFASQQSLSQTPLREVLPAEPINQVIEQAYRPQVTETGMRHPVTSDLPGATGAGDAGHADAGSGPTWGRWFRLMAGQVHAGQTLMSGPENRPLLVVDRVGEGRVALLLSDHIWLWARGFDGGGPQTELMRRLVHWLMKEPELEEENLQAQVTDGRLQVERRSLQAGDTNVTVTDPSGASHPLLLKDGADGIARGEMNAVQSGLWRVSDGVHTALATSGRLDPPELSDLRASPERLAPLIEKTRGGIAWLADGIPDFRWVNPGHGFAGRGWMGMQRNQAFAVTGLTEVPLLPALLLLAAILGGLAGAWWREGR